MSTNDKEDVLLVHNMLNVSMINHKNPISCHDDAIEGQTWLVRLPARLDQGPICFNIRTQPPHFVMNRTEVDN